MPSARETHEKTLSNCIDNYLKINRSKQSFTYFSLLVPGYNYFMSDELYKCLVYLKSNCPIFDDVSCTDIFSKSSLSMNMTDDVVTIPLRGGAPTVSHNVKQFQVCVLTQKFSVNDYMHDDINFEQNILRDNVSLLLKEVQKNVDVLNADPDALPGTTKVYINNFLFMTEVNMKKMTFDIASHLNVSMYADRTGLKLGGKI